MKNNKSTYLLILILLLGLSLLLYPTISEYWNSLHSSQAIAGYSEKVASLDKEDYGHIWEDAHIFNEGIHKRSNVFSLDDAEKEIYNKTLNLTGNGIMGYIEIPEIDCILPIYHGTSDTVLQIAVGHLEWTSLPVGGESTHCVLSGHRGLPSAKLFTDLDKVEEGRQNWVKTLDGFYKDFSKSLEKAQALLDGTKIKLPEEETDEICELCGRNMIVKSGRFGKFLACPGFPECKNTKKIVKKTEGNCARCGSKMLIKKSKNGKSFYGCEKYPECNFMTWDEPIGDVCPKCGATLFRKKGKAGKLYCAKDGCGFERGLKG